MEQKTRVTNMAVRSRTEKTSLSEKKTAVVTNLEPAENGWLVKFLHADQLIRNFAIVGVLMLTVIAVKNSSSPQAQSVFSVLQTTAGMEWDESIGKLSFVNQFLPDEIQAVWDENTAVAVYKPMNGQTIHAWTRSEPYLTILGKTNYVQAAADGEVMSIAHGLEEERIMRIRHNDGTETLYGNLAECLIGEGEMVYAGDLIGKVLNDMPLAFEVRVNGRSVDPDGKWLEWDE